jgi:hypothetical protein
MTQQRYIAHFQPQAWVNDHAVDVDAQGEQEWDCTDFVNFHASQFNLTDIEDEISDDGWWFDSEDLLRYDPAAPTWILAYAGPFVINVRHRTKADAGIPEVREPEPDLLTTPSADALLEAIRSHRDQVYSIAPPNFVIDVELYQAAGVLPDDYEIPDEDELNGSVYSMRKALETAVRDGQCAQSCPALMGDGACNCWVADAKRVLADHCNAKACTCSVHGGETP